MSAKHRTPILLDSQILAAIIEDTLTIAGADKALKPQVLNRAAARLTGPKFNWGRITGSTHPILAQSLSQQAADTTLNALMERPANAGAKEPTVFDDLRARMSLQGVPVRNMPWSDVAPEDILGLPKLDDPEQLAAGFDAFFCSNNPFAMITGDMPHKIEVLQQEAFRQGLEVTKVSLDRIEAMADLVKIAPKPGAITLYSDINENITPQMIAALHHISLAASSALRQEAGAGTKVVFLAGDSGYVQDVVQASIPLVSNHIFCASDKTSSEKALETAQAILDLPRMGAVICWRNREISTQIATLAKRREIDVSWPRLKDVRAASLCEEVLPKPGCLTIYTDAVQADDETLRAICKSIISSWQDPHGQPARVVFEVDHAGPLMDRLRKLQPMLIDRLYWHRTG